MIMKAIHDITLDRLDSVNQQHYLIKLFYYVGVNTTFLVNLLTFHQIEVVYVAYEISSLTSSLD